MYSAVAAITSAGCQTGVGECFDYSGRQPDVAGMVAVLVGIVLALAVLITVAFWWSRQPPKRER